MHLSGLVTSLSKALDPLQSLMDKTYQGAVTYKNIQGVLRTPTAAAYSPLIPANIFQPGGTGERFLPVTTTIATYGTAPLTKAEIRTLQEGLIAKGFNPGPVDGIFGSKTSAGIAAYQRKYSLPVTGQATRDIYEHIMSPSAAPVKVSTKAPPAKPAENAAAASSFIPSFPGWALPAAIGAVGLLMIIAMRDGRGSARR